MSHSLSHRLKMASKITAGLFRTDSNKATWGRVWQFLSRFTWELPQTLSGWLFTSVRALAGQVDRVDVLGGITFAWTEIRANSHAKRYFSRYYQIAWNSQSYPTENYS